MEITNGIHEDTKHTNDRDVWKSFQCFQWVGTVSTLLRMAEREKKRCLLSYVLSSKRTLPDLPGSKQTIGIGDGRPLCYGVIMIVTDEQVCRKTGECR